jgi:putative addiction module CopG family antidote
MNITLKPEQEKLIQEKLKSGYYNTIDEVIIEAFKLLEERDTHHEKRLEETKKTESLTSPDKPIWEVADEIIAGIPKEVLDKLPTDSATQHDHYLYGSPKLQE